MPRRVTVPSPDDLFRPTAVPDPQADVVELPQSPAQRRASEPPDPPRRTPSGRVKHDEKMTVYVTVDELFEIEHARLELRRLHGLGVDRGRIVRAAVAVALADLDEHGDDSLLLQRLRQQA